jgi:hypothetical protein
MTLKNSELYFKILRDGKPLGYIITEENLRYVFPNLSFDSMVDPSTFESRGFAIIELTDPPETTPYQRLSDQGLETKNEDGTWKQNWRIIDATEEERKKIFDDQMKIIVDSQNEMLASLEEQLLDPSYTPEEIADAQKWIDAIKVMDISDPFDVIWPTESTFITLNG